jgi:hypothetical protein
MWPAEIAFKSKEKQLELIVALFLTQTVSAKKQSLLLPPLYRSKEYCIYRIIKVTVLLL